MLTATRGITEEQKRQYREEGYFILEKVIPDEHLEMLRDECQYAIDRIDADMDRQGVDVLGINHRNSRYFANDCYLYRPILGQFIFGDLMADVCRATLGESAYLFNDQYVVKYAEKGMHFSWHQDSGYVGYPHEPYLSCWCALDDVSEENGTVYVLPYSRAGSRDLVEHKKDPKINDLVGYFGDDPGIPVIVPAGSMAVFSSYTFHRSGPNQTDRIRRVYLPQYTATPLKRPDGRFHHQAVPFLYESRRVHQPTW